MKKAYIPLAAFAFLIFVLGVGLTIDPKRVPSALIDKPAPAFDLPQLMQSGQISNKDMLGKVWVLNVWASWCLACRAEHEVIKSLAKLKIVDVLGLNYKDKASDARSWLFDLGNPYTQIAVDLDGRTGINWGVYGVPETFLIDKQGYIRYKHIGPITTKSLQQELLPEIKKLL